MNVKVDEHEANRYGLWRSAGVATVLGIDEDGDATNTVYLQE